MKEKVYVTYEGKKVLYKKLNLTQRKLLAQKETRPEVLELLANEKSKRIRMALYKRAEALPAKIVINLLQTEEGEIERKRMCCGILALDPFKFLANFIYIVFSEAPKVFIRCHEEECEKKLKLCLEAHVLKYKRALLYFSAEEPYDRLTDYLEVLEYIACGLTSRELRAYVDCLDLGTKKQIEDTLKWLVKLTETCKGIQKWSTYLEEVLHFFNTYQTEGVEVRDALIRKHPRYYMDMNVLLNARGLKDYKPFLGTVEGLPVAGTYVVPNKNEG